MSDVKETFLGDAAEGLDKIPSPPAAVKETKAQKVERLKQELNPWEAWADVRRFAAEGRESVLPEWAGVYFKWWGIYTQGDGVGAVGGVGGEGKATEYFMMRVGIPNGILSHLQLRTIAEITETYARGIGDVTTRQNIQMHWLTIESLPLVVEALERVGLSPKGACGDVSRNVTGCPLAGTDPHELLDASPLALRVAATLTANPGVRQPAAQVQGVHHRLPVLVLVSGDRRHRPDRDRTHCKRGARSGLQSSRWRRFVKGAAPRPAPERLHSAANGRERLCGSCPHFSRRGRFAREPEPRPPEIPLHAAGLDGG